MTIASITSFPLRIPYDVGGPKQAFMGTPRTHLEALFVRVETDDGVVGWGECFGINLWRAVRVVLEETIAPYVLGHDEDGHGALVADLARRLHLHGRGGLVLHALSGLDIALWDIAGKKAGRPLHALFGAQARASVPVYASLMRYAAAEPLQRNCERARAAGYDAVKIHEATLGHCMAAREALGAAALIVDANCAWTLEQATALLPGLEALDLAWLEEPTWPPEDVDQLAALHARTRLPLAAGENASTTFELVALARSGALAIVQPSVTKIGGITAMRRFIDAAPRPVRIVPHSPYFGPGLLATLHIAAASDEETTVERLFCDFEAHPLGDAIAAVDGRLRVPAGPGLGVVPDPGWLSAFAAPG